MLAEKNRLHRIYQLDQSSAAKKTAFINIRRTVQTRLCKTRGSLPKQMKFRIKLTLTTQSASMMPWKHRNHQARLHYSMWMGQHLSLTKLPCWTGGWSILVLSSTDQHISMPKLLPVCHKLRQTLISTDHRARRKSRRQSSNSLLEKPQAQMPSQPKFTSMVVTRCYRRWQTLSGICEMRK